MSATQSSQCTYQTSKVKKMAQFYEQNFVKDLSKLDSLVKENTSLKQQCKDLRKDFQKDLKSQLSQNSQRYERKLDDARRRLISDKEKELHVHKMQCKKEFEDRISTAEQVQARELRRMKAQNNKLQQQLYNITDQASFSRSSDGSSRSRIRSELVEAKREATDCQRALFDCRKDIDRLKEKHHRELQQMIGQTRQHVRSLLEEIRTKEKHVGRLENSLRQLQAQLLSRSTNNNSPDLCSSSTIDRPGSSKKSSSKKMSKSISSGSHSFEILEEKVKHLENQLHDAEEAKNELSMLDRSKVTQIVVGDDDTNESVPSLQLKLDKFNLDCRNMQSELDTSREYCSVLEDKLVDDRKALSEENGRMTSQMTQQNKTIAALKQAAIEKDRRMDLLQHKIRRLRSSKSMDIVEEAENVSTFGSELSHSNASLDTILEDWEELAREEIEENYRQLAREHLELQRSYSALSRLHAEPRRLEDKIRRLQNELETVQSKFDTANQNCHREGISHLNPISLLDETNTLKARIVLLEKQRDAADQKAEDAAQELLELHEQKDLIEFQLLEISSDSKPNTPLPENKIAVKTVDRSVSTSDDEGVLHSKSLDSGNDSPTDGLTEIMESPLSPEEVKIRFALLKHRRELAPADRQTVAQMKELFDQLQKQHGLCSHEIKQSREHGRQDFQLAESQYQAEIEKLQAQVESVRSLNGQNLKNKKSKEFVAQIEKLDENLHARDAELKQSLQSIELLTQELAKMQFALNFACESEQSQRCASETLRGQLNSLKENREKELNLVQQSMEQQALELENYRKRIDTTEAEKFVLERDFETVKAEKIVTEKKVQSLEQIVVTEKLKNEEITTLHGLVERKRVENDKLQTIVAQYKIELEKYSADQKNLELELAKSTEESKQLKFQIENFKQLENQYDRLSGDQRSLIEELGKAQEHSTKLRKELDGLKGVDEKLTSEIKCHRLLDEKYNDLKLKYHDAKDLLKDHEMSGRKSEEKIKSLLELQKSLESRVDELTTENNERSTAAKIALEHAQGLNTERENFFTALKSTQKENLRLAGFVEELELQIKQEDVAEKKSKWVTELMSENRKLRADVDLLKRAQMDELGESDQYMVERLRQVELECDELRHKAESYNERDKLQDEIMTSLRKELFSDADSVKAKSWKLEGSQTVSEIVELKSESVAAKQKVIWVTKELRTLEENDRKEMRWLKENADSLKNLVKEQSLKLDEKSELMHNMDNDYQKLSIKLSNLARERDNLKNQLARESRPTPAELEALNEKVAFLETVVESQAESLSDFDRMKHQFIQLQSYNQQLEAQFEVQIKTVQFLKDQIIKLQSEYQSKLDETTSLHQSQIALESKYHDACSRLESINYSQKDFNSEIYDKIIELESTMDDLRRELQEKDDEIAHYKLQSAKLKPDDLSDSDDEELVQIGSRFAAVQEQFRSCVLEVAEMQSSQSTTSIISTTTQTGSSWNMLQKHFMDLMDNVSKLQDDIELGMPNIDESYGKSISLVQRQRRFLATSCLKLGQMVGAVVKLIQFRRRLQPKESYSTDTAVSNDGVTIVNALDHSVNISLGHDNNADDISIEKRGKVAQSTSVSTMTEFKPVAGVSHDEDPSSDSGLEISVDWHKSKNTNDSTVLSSGSQHSPFNNSWQGRSSSALSQQKDAIIQKLIERIKSLKKDEGINVIGDIESELDALRAVECASVSPLQLSGTESELNHHYGEHSPVGSTSSGSSTSGGNKSSRPQVEAEPKLEATPVKSVNTESSDWSSEQYKPSVRVPMPRKLRLKSKVDDTNGIVTWEKPITESLIFGYKIYQGVKLLKIISDPESLEAAVPLPQNRLADKISVTLLNNERAESAKVSLSFNQLLKQQLELERASSEEEAVV